LATDLHGSSRIKLAESPPRKSAAIR